MPFKEFEFTKASDIVQEQNSQVAQMLQGRDPRAGHSQALVNAITNIFDPKIKNARQTEEVVSNAMGMEREEGEDFMDFQIRQQKAIMEGAAATDPNVSVQASQNMAHLMTEKRERGRIDQKDAQAAAKFKWAIRKEEMEQTPVIEQLNPSTGQWEAIEVGRYGTDTFESYKAKTDELNKAGGQYRVNKESSLYTMEDLKKDGTGLKLGATLTRQTIEGYEAVTTTMASFEPLVNLLEQDNFALQGISFNKDGTLKSSQSNSFFKELENLGQQVKGTLNSFDAQFMQDANGDTVDIQSYVADILDKDPQIAKNLQERGLAAGIAQGIIIDIGYALAKMRDDGRLSDQDVSLAIRSLTGQGGIAEIGELLNVQVAKARTRVDTLNRRISETPGAIPQATIDAATEALIKGQKNVLRLREQASKQGKTTLQTEQGGTTPEERKAIRTKYDDITTSGEQ
jgi:hypothetical protein